MDDEDLEEKKEEEKEHKAPQEIRVKKDPFAFFGKIAAIAIVIALLVGGGVYVGSTMNQNTNSGQVTPTPTVSGSNNNEIAPSPAPTTTSASTLDKSGTAGAAKGTSFKLYAYDYPSTWTPARETTDVSDKLTLTNGAYSIAIYQAPMGGGGCLYPGDAPSEMAQTYKKYEEIQGAEYKLRRSWSAEAATVTYTVCATTDGTTYGSPTSYGAITIKAPNPSDANIMSEVDAILASLKTL